MSMKVFRKTDVCGFVYVQLIGAFKKKSCFSNKIMKGGKKSELLLKVASWGKNKLDKSKLLTETI